MGAKESRYNWKPPPEPEQTSSVDSPVDYHLVGAPVNLDLETQTCDCTMRYEVTMDSDTLYGMLFEQYPKKYRMLYFHRVPAEMSITSRMTDLNIIFQGFFRMNPNYREHNGDPVSWELRIDRCFIQTHTTEKSRSEESTRAVNIDALVDCITRNTQNGERLVAATVTGHCTKQTSKELSSGYGPHNAVDLFFEFPCPIPEESYVYNIALVPVRVEFNIPSTVYFPDILCDWAASLNFHLNQGWRLVDIYIDYPIVEQMRTSPKQLRFLCKHIQTNALWIFEKPRSRVQDSAPLYEGTIVEQVIPVQDAKGKIGVRSSYNWLTVVRDMGSRGWELACVVECHSVEAPSSGKVNIKSLLFFQRPLS